MRIGAPKCEVQEMRRRSLRGPLKGRKPPAAREKSRGCEKWSVCFRGRRSCGRESATLLGEELGASEVVGMMRLCGAGISKL